MNKVQEILQSYITMMNPSDDKKELAEKRLEVCHGCEHWVQNLVYDHCGICKCATKAKVFSPKGSNACPKNYWIE